MRAKLILVLLAAAAPLALPPAHAQTPGAMPSYEPSQRMRLLEGCMKDEEPNGPNCVKKCQPDFRLDLQKRPPVCVGVKRDAKYTPPPPSPPRPPAPPGPRKPGF
jgi:hypothetical protein